MLIKDILKWGEGQLGSASSSARLDAEILLAHILKKPLTFLLAHNEEKISWWTLWRYRRAIQKRRQGIPVAYLTGYREFYFLDFLVNRHVLVPRPDTEILVAEVIDYIQGLRTRNYGLSPFLVDVGTGTGCIPISVLKNIQDLKAVATDISGAALNVAKKNAKKHGVSDRLQFIQSDLLKNISPDLFKNKDLVVTANLPYVPKTFPVNPDTAFEPSLALYGGQDGLDIYRDFLRQLKSLEPRAVFLELFDFQIPSIEKLLPGYGVKMTKPLTGKARMILLQPKNPLLI